MLTKTMLFIGLLLFHFNVMAQNSCAIKIGSNYFIDCKHLISYKGIDVLSLEKTPGDSITVNFDVYATNGQKVATVNKGKIVEGNKDLFEIMANDTAYTFIEKATSRIIVHIHKYTDPNSNKCVMDTWADMYMPTGFYFQCTPDTTNVNYLNWMRGNTIQGAGNAISLN